MLQLPGKKYLLFMTVVIGLGFAGAAAAKTEPSEWLLGNQQLNLTPPADHIWVNKDGKILLKMLPSRYNSLVSHFISLHRKPYVRDDGLARGLQAGKPYNNYCGLIYLGSPDKIWTRADLAEMKKYLLPSAKAPGQGAINQGGEYLRNLMKETVGYEVSPDRGKKYYERLQQAKVLENTPDSIIIQLPHRKPKQKDRYVTFSLFLVKGKFLGTVYYQNDPSPQELARVGELTAAWKSGLVAINQ